jgi:nucleotide-binding universal stress UspA family protein
MAIHSILVPTDFSVDAARALEMAIELAQPTQAKIHLLHSCFFGCYLGGYPEPVGVPMDFVERVRAEVRTRLEQLEKRVARAGLSAASHISEETPVSAIVDRARGVDADLIVMGTRGLTGVKHAVLGSVAERTVRLAPCPVLTVKAAPESA